MFAVGQNALLRAQIPDQAAPAAPKLHSAIPSNFDLGDRGHLHRIID